MPALERVGSSEQWYRMNKAQNFNQFYKAVSMGQTTMFNIVYADRFDTIMYLNNAVMPKRNPNFDYSGVIGLHSDQVLWNTFHPTEDLVQYINPSCGYVFNTNNLPTNATCAAEQHALDDFPKYFGFTKDAGNNNRALRFMDLISWSGEMTFERMKEIKFDQEFRACTKMYESIEHLLMLDLSDEPRIAQLQQHIINWDGCADQNSIGAGVYLLVFQTIFKALKYNDVQFKTAIEVPQSTYIAALHEAQTHLDKYFNGQAVPLGELQRHVRADVNLALGGFPDALAANYNQPWQNGRFKPLVADSYTHFVAWTPGDSLPYFETLHPFGASNRIDSPHYTDQMRPYAEQTPKVMTLDRAAILRNATRVYSPQ
jgi:acyl-homoserine-lactone acylase